jgi:Ca-activated chloride channel family protein
MNMRRIIRRVRLLSAAAIGTVIVVSCASQAVFESPPPPEPRSTGGIEEIVVTGAAPAQRPWAERGRQSGLMRRIATDTFDEEDSDRALSSVGPDEELWIIATPSSAPGPDRNEDDSPGSGAMVASFADDIDEETGSARTIPLPLKHTEVRASIDGYISTVNVRQKFDNPFNEKIEAVYMFPLPEKAAVSEFLMIIGERRIRGILREKEEAEAIYNEARSQGYQASLLVQHRPNIFEQKVANIEPGKAIDVDIKYFHTLAYSDGWYSFVFPTVVGPRYNPPDHKDPIVPAPRGSVLPEAGGTAVRYLRPNERSAHDLSIAVAIDAGVAIEELQSSHKIVTSRNTAASAAVELANETTIPNQDFILKFRVAGDTIKSNLLTYEDPDTNQGYFTLMLYPPAGTGSLARRPMEMVFVLDCSGSMSGRPLEQAKAAVTTALDRLQEGDTFQIIRFSDDSSQFGATPVPATRRNLQQARRYLAGLNGTGGTQMIEGVKAALDFPHDPARLRFVSFMTDGYIGNETDILAAVHNRIGSARIFSFGVGSSVNRYLLERMAKEGRGAVAYLGPRDSADELMDGFFNRISHPALTDVRIDWGGMAVSDVYPAKLPDLFVGRPVVVTGKYLGAASDVAVSGMTGTVGHSFGIDAAGTEAGNAYIPKIWARLRIAELSDRQAWESDPYGELENAIKSTALEYQLMSAYTSFVAVDTSQRTEGTHGTTVHQAVPVPDGVRYETTVDPE